VSAQALDPDCADSGASSSSGSARAHWPVQDRAVLTSWAPPVSSGT
jgi:hypothetical protein